MRLFLRLFIPVVLIAIAYTVLAQTTTPAVPTDPQTIVGGILTAFAGKKWTILVGFILAALIFVMRTYVLASWKWAQTSRGGAILALAIGVVGVVAAELIAGTASVMSVIDGVLASWVASGMFSQVKAVAKTPPAV